MAAFNYKSLAWRMARANKLVEQRYRCEGCGRDCTHDRGRVQVHHTVGARRFPELALNDQYLSVLDVTCHEAVTRCIRYPKLAELVRIGIDPRIAGAVREYGPVPWQFDLGIEAANEETFTLDPPIEVTADD